MGNAVHSQSGERIKVRRSGLLLVTILAGWTLLKAVPQAGLASSQATMPAASDGKIGASAIWQPPQEFLNKAHTVCEKGAGPASFDQCFMNQIAAAGAPADAVSFTRMLYQQNGGLVGIMTGFKKYGPVDAAQVLYPLRANDNYALLLVNGDPKILDIDDLQKLDRAALERDPMLQGVKKKFAQTDIWPGDRSSSTPWPRVQPLPAGGAEFIVSYPLINGCHACQHVGVARFGWDFDASGKFLRTVYIATPPPPKLTRPTRQPQAPPAPPPTTQPAPLPQQ
jgi:hypothetical protein